MFNSIRFFLKLIRRVYYSNKVRSTAKSCGKRLRVNGKSSVTNKTILGDGVNFNGMEITGHGSVVIGNNFHSGPGCLIISHNHNYDHGTKIPYDDTYILKDVVIGDQVWFGSRVIVLAGVKIGEGAIIQAGSVVVSDIPQYAIAGGHPCRVFSSRDIVHYEELKRAGQFY